MQLKPKEGSGPGKGRGRVLFPLDRPSLLSSSPVIPCLLTVSLAGFWLLIVILVKVGLLWSSPIAFLFNCSVLHFYGKFLPSLYNDYSVFLLHSHRHAHAYIQHTHNAHTHILRYFLKILLWRHEGKGRLSLAQLLSRVRLFATLWTVAYQAPPSMGFPGKSTGVGCLFLLQGIFPTQGSNPGLPHCRQTLYPLSHQGSPQGRL